MTLAAVQGELDLKLIDLDPELVEEFEFVLTGTSGFIGGEDLQPTQRVKGTFAAEVIGVRVVKKTRKLRNGEEESFFVRTAVIKIDDAVVAQEK